MVDLAKIRAFTAFNKGVLKRDYPDCKFLLGKERFTEEELLEMEKYLSEYCGHPVSCVQKRKYLHVHKLDTLYFSNREVYYGSRYRRELDPQNPWYKTDEEDDERNQPGYPWWDDPEPWECDGFWESV